MTFNDGDHWVIVRLRYGPTDLWLHYEDCTGITRVPPNGPVSDQVWLPRPLPPSNLIGDVLIPGDFDALFRSVLAAVALTSPVPWRLNVPLPIFFEAPPRHNASQHWEQIIEGLLPADVNRDLVQMVQLSVDKGPVKQIRSRFLFVSLPSIRLAILF